MPDDVDPHVEDGSCASRPQHLSTAVGRVRGISETWDPEKDQAAHTFLKGHECRARFGYNCTGEMRRNKQNAAREPQLELFPF